MKTTPSPSAAVRRISSKRRPTSARASGPVGSSRMSSRLLRRAAFAISIICSSATPSSPTGRDGLMPVMPRFRRSARASRRCARAEIVPSGERFSALRKMLSTTESVGISESSCSTIPTPAERASAGRE